VFYLRFSEKNKLSSHFVRRQWSVHSKTDLKKIVAVLLFFFAHIAAQIYATLHVVATQPQWTRADNCHTVASPPGYTHGNEHMSTADILCMAQVSHDWHFG
jgi:hypothetical protein